MCVCVQDMITALKGALSGSLEAVVLGLMKSTTQYDASEIKGSIKVSSYNNPNQQPHDPFTALDTTWNFYL